MSALKMPSLAEARMLLNLLSGRPYDFGSANVALRNDHCASLMHLGWMSGCPDTITPSGRDALARYLLRGLR